MGFFYWGEERHPNYGGSEWQTVDPNKVVTKQRVRDEKTVTKYQNNPDATPDDGDVCITVKNGRMHCVARGGAGMSDIWMAIGIGVAVPLVLYLPVLVWLLLPWNWERNVSPEERQRITQQYVKNYQAGLVAGIEQGKERR
jgi:hypothetical protein